MTKFIVGLLLGLIVGIAGTATFLISAHGGDYLVATSPRVRELEASLKQADQERRWLRDQLRQSSDVLTKLESRFVGLATRFDDLTSHAATVLGAPPAATPSSPRPAPEADLSATARSSQSPAPIATRAPESPTETPTPTAPSRPEAQSTEGGTGARAP